MKNLLKKVSFLFALIITLRLPIAAAQASTCPPHNMKYNRTELKKVTYNNHEFLLWIGIGENGEDIYFREICSIATENYVARYDCSNCTYYYYTSAYINRRHLNPRCPNY